MPEFAEHQRQAYHNLDLLSFFVSHDSCKKFADWYVTVSFYSALHFVEAIFQHHKTVAILPNGIQVKVAHSSEAKDFYNRGAQKVFDHVGSDHSARRQLMHDNSLTFSGVIPAYNTLYEKCQVARYYCNDPESHDYIEAEELITDMKKWFESIKS